MKKILLYVMAAYIFMGSNMACKKFLDAKPDQKLATIETAADMQAVLDNFNVMNYTDPAMGEACADNYLMTDVVYNARDEYDRNLYTWAQANVFKPQYNAWKNCYTQVNMANTVLAAVNDYSGEQNVGLATIKAQAFFFRAKAFYHALSIWSMPFDSQTAATLPGIPLRLNANFNEQSERATIAAGYTQVETDLKNSIGALPAIAITPMRPSKAAAYGMLSRLYLQLRNYNLAGKYADSCLQLNGALLDYNTLNTSVNFPIPRLNVEVIFEGRAETAGPVVQARALVVPELYALYNVNDLRKAAFYKASGTSYVFKGSYEAGATLFNGITTAEMLLSRAECYARTDKVVLALADLNLLLSSRYKKGSFVAIATADAQILLNVIKQERRKELAFRCMRWLDVRRYNEEGDNIIMSRTVEGKQYTLLPKSKGYALPIPEDVITLSGMNQN